MRQILFVAVFASLFAGSSRADECHVASYRLTDGRAIDIAPAAEGAMRWRMEDGGSGKLTRADERVAQHPGMDGSRRRPSRDAGNL